MCAACRGRRHSCIPHNSRSVASPARPRPPAIMAWNLLTALLALLLVDRLGRRHLLLPGLGLMAASLLLMDPAAGCPWRCGRNSNPYMLMCRFHISHYFSMI